MDANPFDQAAEFCKLVGVPSLLEYLGASVGAAPAEVADKLKARRKYMQGMQANPKYKAEALFLIKNFGALAEALADPRVYAEDVARRAEAAHLSTLEVTMRGVLAAGRITSEQEQFLRSRARELKVSDRSYERLLRRIAHETSAELPLPPPTPSLMPVSTAHPKVASLAPVGTPSAPPDRRDTAPPVRRVVGPGGVEGLPARLEVLGEPVRTASAHEPGAVLVAVRNRGSGSMPGTVRADVPWLVPVQSQLEPDLPQQTLEVRVAPALVPPGEQRGRVHIQAGHAGSATIEVVLEARRSRAVWVAAFLGVSVLVAVAAGIALGLAGATASTLVVHVDPEGTVSLNGEVIGSGTTLRVEHPPTGPVEIAVTGGARFAPWNRRIEVAPGEVTEVDVDLELAKPLARQPAADQLPGCDDTPSRRAVGARLPALKRCLAEQGDAPASVVVRIGTDGHADAMELTHERLPNKAMRCIERQVAALRLEPSPAAPCIVAFEIPRP